MKKTKKKNRSLQTLLGFTFIAIAAMLWLLPDTDNAATTPKEKNDLPAVKLAPVEASPTHQSLTFSGVIQPKNRALLSFAVPARVTHKKVNVGDHVEKNQVLLTLDPREYKNRLSAAQAAFRELEIRLIQAERTKKRIEKLADAEAATAEELEHVVALADATKAGKDAALAQLSETERILEETRLKAPFPGTVTAILIEPGEFAAPGRPVIEISGDGDLELQVEIPETVISNIQVDKQVDIRLPFSSNRIITGKITSISKAAIGPGRLFPLKIDITDTDNISAGMTAELLLTILQEDSLIIPLEAVMNPGSSFPSVFCLRNNIIKKVPIRLGRIMGDTITFKGDLSVGDRVVIKGHTRIEDGDRVEVLL